MNEQKWLECTNPIRMLEYLEGRASDRKIRLFACACCRHIWYQLTEEPCQKAVEEAERFADGMTTSRELQDAANAVDAAFHAANAVLNAADDADSAALYAPDAPLKVALPTAAALDSAVALLASGNGHYNALRATYHVASTPAHKAAASAARSLSMAAVSAAAGLDNIPARYAAYDSVIQYQRELFRDIFGNPFHPVTLNPSWLTATVTNFATVAYEERALPSGELDSARLALLADALQDAGCDNADLLHHCRSEGPHVRGCWVVDLLLGKE